MIFQRYSQMEKNRFCECYAYVITGANRLKMIFYNPKLSRTP